MSRQSDLDYHANQLNPNNDAYWESRGYEDRPDDLEDRVAEENDLYNVAQSKSEKSGRRQSGARPLSPSGC